MSEIIMGKPKHVGESMMVTDLGDGVLVLGTPDEAYNPITRHNEKIVEAVKSPLPTTCPNCKKQNSPGVDVVLLESGYFVYACPSCNQFVWCRIKKNREM